MNLSERHAYGEIGQWVHRVVLLTVITISPVAPPARAEWLSMADDGVTGEVTDIFETHSGRLYFRTADKTYLYDGFNLSSRSWRVFAAYEDSVDVTWEAAYNAVVRYFPDQYRTYPYYFPPQLGYPISLVLPNQTVTCGTSDHLGRLWFGTTGGLVRYQRGSSIDFDSTSWKVYTTADGLVGDSVVRVAEDRAGNIWAATTDGISRFDGVTWTNYTAAQGIPSYAVHSMVEDRGGNVWLATEAGAVRFDGSSWRTFSTTDGLPSDTVYSVENDRRGDIWFGTALGACRYDGVSIQAFAVFNDPTPRPVMSIFEDHLGAMWFAAAEGLYRYVESTPDIVPPKIVFALKPPAILTSRVASAAFALGFHESGRVWFSARIDGGTWSDWSWIPAWTAPDPLMDGPHAIEVRARDDSWNIDTVAVVARFEVDATPPAPVITSPGYGSFVRGVVPIYGTVEGPRIYAWNVDVRRADAPSWANSDARHLLTAYTTVTNELLVEWDASKAADGAYEIRLEAWHILGMYGAAYLTVIVDNHAPFSDVTTPARIAAATGGDVFSIDGDTRLYFPPHAFTHDAIVTVAANEVGAVPSSLPSGGVRVLNGCEISWTSSLEKPGRFTMSFAGANLPQSTLAVYRSTDGTTWTRLGGTVDIGAKTISLPVTQPGRYALFGDGGLGSGVTTLSSLALTPRVFSPTGNFADREVGIGFTLGRAAPVTVKVFSKSGRLIREVVKGETMNAGDNLVRWDGSDRNGGYVADGVYLVTVEALGETKTKPLAVVK